MDRPTEPRSNKPRLPKKRAQKLFLQMLSECGNVAKCVRDLGYDFGTFYKWRKSDPAFAEGWEQALESALDRIEAEVHTRHAMGDAGTAKWLLSRRRPDKYGERTSVDEPKSQDLRVEIVLEDDPRPDVYHTEGGQ